MYAIWTQNKYQVTFNTNGGSSVENKEVTYDLAYGNLPSTTKTGYTFSGWYLDNETFKNKIETTTKVKIANNHTLYAKWTEGESEYIVEHYKQNIEDDQYGEPEVETLTAVTGSEVTPATKDYGKGFETPNLKSAVVKADGSTIIKYYYNRKLFTVTFNTNGGNSVENITAKYEKEVTLPTTSKTGYTFKGWLNQELEVTSPYKVEDNVTLSAKWNAITYNITYSLNGGNLEEGITNPKNYTIETASFTLNNPQKDGYTFTGWTGSNGTTPNTTVTISKGTTGDKEFIANWKANEYIVTFNPDEGTVNPSSKTVTYNENYGQLPTPIKTGYKFNGWYTGLNGTGTKITEQSVVTITANQTLYASWSVNSYTITYNANGGSGAPGSQTKKYNESLTLSATKPTRTGYTFKGWTTLPDSQIAQYNPGDNYSLDQDITLYAIWEKSEYTIHYDANDNGEGTAVPNDQTKEKGTDITLSDIEPEREGYIFKGWSTNKEATTGEYQPSDTFGVDADTTLYAIWEEKLYLKSTEYVITDENNYVEDAKLIENTYEDGDTHIMGILPKLTTESEDTATEWTKGTKLEDFKKNINTNADEIKLYDMNNNEITKQDRYLGTGMIIEFIKGNQNPIRITIVAKGDINGDGILNIGDVTKAKKYIRTNNITILDTVTKKLAFDVNMDGKLNMKDANNMQRAQSNDDIRELKK